jgi:hypothetical protein
MSLPPSGYAVPGCVMLSRVREWMSDQDPVSARQPVTAQESWIRPLRAVVGILLLAVAWAGLLTMAVLVHNVASMPLRLWPPSFRILFPILELVAAVWIGMVTATSVLVSSFLVWLALTERGW